MNKWRLVIGREGEGTGLFIGRKENDQPIALALHSDPNPFDQFDNSFRISGETGGTGGRG